MLFFGTGPGPEHSGFVALPVVQIAIGTHFIVPGTWQPVDVS